MPSVTIDPGVLAVPALSADRDDVYAYVETILDWGKLLDEPWVAIYMTERAVDLLLEEGLYPLRNALKQLFSAKSVIEYDANTLARVAERVLQKTPSFETYFKVREVLFDSLTTEPDLLSIHANSGLVSDLARCILLIAILRTHCRNSVLNHTLIVRRCGDAPIVRVRALIYDIEHTRSDIGDLPTPPEYFEGTILACANFHTLLAIIDETIVWQLSEDLVALKTAVQIATYKSRLERGLDPDWDGIPGFSFGHSFFGTAKAYAQSDSLITRTLRSMVETLDGLNLADTHRLRVGKGGNSPPIVRGEDEAWRRDIDEEYHLHYWKCPDGLVEFASIVTHNDYSIPG